MADNRRWFQWVVGEKRGQVFEFDSIVEEDGDVFITFKDGSRMNQNLIAELNRTDLTNMMMAEVDSYNNIWKFEESIVGEEIGRTEVDWESQTRYEVPTITEIASGGTKVPVQRKKVTLVPPTRTRPDVVSSRFGTVIISKPVQSEIAAAITQPVQTINQNDPVYIMMNKSKKIDTEVEMVLTISLPSESLYNVAKESFENGAEKALEYIIESIDITKIKEALKIGIKHRYEVIYEAPNYQTDDALLNSMYESAENGDKN